MNKKIIPIVVAIFLFVISCNLFQPDVNITSSNFPLKEQWSSIFDHAVYNLGVADDWVAVGQSNGITAIDTESGKTMWKLDFQLDHDSLLLISNDELVAASSSQLFVINKTGEIIHTINLRPKQSTEVVAMYADYVFVYRRADGLLEAYSIQNEKLAWYVITHRGGVSVNFDSRTNTVYITSSSFVSANKITDGSEIWKKDIVGRTGILDSDTFYYFSELSPAIGYITAANERDGSELWKIDEHFSIRTTIYNLTITGNLLVASTDYGLIAFDKNNGNELWQSETNDFFYGNPIPFDDILYIRGTNTDTIYAINPQSGIYFGYLYLGNPSIISHREYELIYKSGNYLIFPYNHTVYAYHQ